MAATPTISVLYAGKRYALPTVYQGRRIDNDQAFDLFVEGKIKPLSVQDTYTPASEAPPARASRS